MTGQNSLERKVKQHDREQSCIVVTGASRGIGAAIALRLAGAGYTVACLSRSGTVPAPDADAAIEQAPEGAAGRLLPFTADVTSAEALREAFEAVADRGLAVRGVVNNAGLHREMPSAEITPEHWNEILSTNLTAVLFGCQAAYPHLVKAGGGLIVNIGSFYERLGVKRNAAYCASKAGVGALTRCLAVEWARYGIRVLDVAPGYILTDLNREAMAEPALRDFLAKRIPGREPGTADEVGRFVASLYTLDSPFLTGETLWIDGGQTIAL